MWRTVGARSGRMRSSALAAVVLLVTGVPARAQVAPARDPLAVPAGAILCHSTRAESGVMVLRVVDLQDPALQRDITVAYDSAGAPVFINVFAPERTAGGSVLTRAFGAGLGASAAGIRSSWIEESDSSAGASRPDSVSVQASAPVPREPMDVGELARARALAVALWSRRCR